VGGVAAVLVVALLVGLWIRSQRTSSEIAAQIDSMKVAAEEGRLDDVYDHLLTAGLSLEYYRLAAIADSTSGTVAVSTNPQGATVTVKRVTPISSFDDRRPVELGVTPIVERRVVAGEYYLRITAADRVSIEGIFRIDPGGNLAVSRDIFENAAQLSDAVFVPAGQSPEGRAVPAFWIDRTEVTNEQFFRFVADGGYREPTYWPETMILDGRSLERSDAIERLVDRTSLPGPRFWSGGTFPPGMDSHPVVGVTWYEAAAYALWAGKVLPSWDQFWRAAIGEGGRIYPWGDDVGSIDARANFGLSGTRAVASFTLGISPFGCYDMAGNVREWLGDSTSDSDTRYAVGGSWQEPVYLFEPDPTRGVAADQISEAAGFRCARPASNGKEQ
jgi:formylglycine-generating enzyme required for sulfatase activity